MTSTSDFSLLSSCGLHGLRRWRPLKRQIEVYVWLHGYRAKSVTAGLGCSLARVLVLSVTTASLTRNMWKLWRNCKSISPFPLFVPFPSPWIRRCFRAFPVRLVVPSLSWRNFQRTWPASSTAPAQPPIWARVIFVFIRHRIQQLAAARAPSLQMDISHSVATIHHSGQRRQIALETNEDLWPRTPALLTVNYIEYFSF